MQAESKTSPNLSDSQIEPPKENSEHVDPLHLLYESWTPIQKKSHLIFQKNSISVIGIPTALCDSEILSGPEYFGQYGKIISITAKVRRDKFKGNEFTNY